MHANAFIKTYFKIRFNLLSVECSLYFVFEWEKLYPCFKSCRIKFRGKGLREEKKKLT